MPIRKPRLRARAGEGTIYALADGRWCASVSIGGRTHRKRIKRVCESEGAALEALRQIRSQYASAQTYEDGRTIVEAHLRQWLADRKPQIRANTFAQYEGVLRVHVFGDPIAKMRLDQVRPRHVADLLVSLDEHGVGLRLRELVYMRLRSAFAAAVGGGIESNPVLPIHRPRAERRTMKTWTADEARRFLDATAGDELGRLYRVALSVGLRRGELLGLRWIDVDLKARRIAVQHTLTAAGEIANPKTPGSRRAIVLPVDTAKALVDQKAALLARGLRASPWVFPDSDGTAYPARKLSRAFNAATIKAGVPVIRFHDLRHTSATLLLERGINVKVVSEMLGHASVQITLDLYAHVTPSMQQAAADCMDGILS